MVPGSALVWCGNLQIGWKKEALLSDLNSNSRRRRLQMQPRATVLHECLQIKHIGTARVFANKTHLTTRLTSMWLSAISRRIALVSRPMLFRGEQSRKLIRGTTKSRPGYRLAYTTGAHAQELLRVMEVTQPIVHGFLILFKMYHINKKHESDFFFAAPTNSVLDLPDSRKLRMKRHTVVLLRTGQFAISRRN
jgi:hypothetical protein